MRFSSNLLKSNKNTCLNKSLHTYAPRAVNNSQDIGASIKSSRLLAWPTLPCTDLLQPVHPQWLFLCSCNILRDNFLYLQMCSTTKSAIQSKILDDLGWHFQCCYPILLFLMYWVRYYFFSNGSIQKISTRSFLLSKKSVYLEQCLWQTKYLKPIGPNTCGQLCPPQTVIRSKRHKVQNYFGMCPLIKEFLFYLYLFSSLTLKKNLK